MYYLAEAVYNNCLPCSREHMQEVLLPAHAAYIKNAAELGIVLLGGPKAEEDGGFLLIRAESRDALDSFLNGDPMVTAGVQAFRITEWRILDKAPSVDALLTQHLL